MSIRTEEFHVKFSADNAQYKNAMEDSKKSAQGFLESENKVKRGLTETVGALASATDGADLLAKSAGGLENAFKSSLAIGGAVAAGLALRDVLVADAKRMNELSDASAEVFGKSGMNAQTKSVEELGSTYQKATAAARAYRDENQRLKGVTGFLTSSIGMLAGGDSGIKRQSDNREKANDLDKEAERLQKEMAKVESGRADIAEKIAQGRNEEASDLAKSLTRAKEIQAAEDAGNHSGIEGIKRRQAAEDDLQERQERFQEIDIEAREKVNSIARGNGNVELAAAEDLFEKRKKIYDLTTDPALKRAASVDEDEAYTALKAAREAQSAQIQALSTQVEISHLRGSEYEIQSKTLDISERQLKVEQATAKAVRQLEIQRDLAGIDKSRTQLNKGDALSRLGLAGQTAGAQAGGGEEAQIALQKQMITLKLAELAIETKSQDRDDKKIISLQAELALQLKDLNLAQAQKSVKDAQYQAESATIDIQASASAEASKRYEITQAQITAVKAEIAAMQQLNPELAKAAELRLRGLQNDERKQDQELNMGKSGKEIRARFRAQDKEKKEVEKFKQKRDDDRGLIPIHRGMSGEVIEGFNPSTGKKESREPGSGLDRELGDMDLKPRLGEQMKKDSENFENRFKAGPQIGDLGQKDKPVVGDAKEDLGKKLDDIKDAVLKAIAK